ncbi:MAG: LemA family protein [Phycisphaerae bacterium]
MVPFFVVLGMLVLFGLLIGYSYSTLMSRRLKCRDAWAELETHLKRRYSVVPTLLETLSSYVSLEKQRLDRLAKARERAMATETVQEQAAAEDELTEALDDAFELVDKYPDLRANATLVQLEEELTSAENKITFAKQQYNNAVAGYNTARHRFPSSMAAKLFKMDEMAFFEIRDVGHA